jgi:hypothetical protein
MAEKVGEVWVESYQPVDESGNPVGPLQKFEGKTQAELLEKIVAAHKNASVKVHQLQVANKLGTLLEPDPEEPIVEFKERQLTADERVKINKMLADPGTAPEAYKIMLEAQLGAPANVIRQKFQELEINKRQDKARVEGAAFLKAHPEYVDVDANNDLIVKYLNKRKLGYTKKNIEIAYEDLKNSGVLIIQSPVAPVSKAIETPTPASQATIPPVVTPVPGDSGQPKADTQVPTGEQPPLQPKQSSSGLKRDNSSAQPGTEAPKTAGISIREINRMSAAEYSERLKDPEFRKQVEALFAKK